MPNRRSFPVRPAFVAAMTFSLLLWSRATAEAASPRAIQIGSKALTEGVILGEMLALLAEHAGFKAKHLAAMGGTQIVFQALENGSIDAYADYTGTLTQEILKSERIRDEHGMREALATRGIGMTNKLGLHFLLVHQKYAQNARQEVFCQSILNFKNKNCHMATKLL